MNKPYRFDLDTALAAWRRSLQYNRAFTADDLDELEQHLRDQIAGLVEQGLSKKAAFSQALREMGDYGTAEAEYRKVYWGKRRRHGEVLRELTWGFSMLTNYFKIAFRNFKKKKGYSFINVAGLAVGLACSFFILLWVQDERSYNRFLEDGDRIHRVWRNVDIDGEVHTLHQTPQPLGEALRASFPEIEALTPMSWEQWMIVTYGDESFRREANYGGADFFQVFPFPFLQGDPATALQGTSTVVITDRLARNLFGADWQTKGDVLGKRLTIDHERDYTISGVLQDLPHHSSIQFDVLLPMEDFFQRNAWTQYWTANSFPLYVKLKEGTSKEVVNAKIADVVMEHRAGAREVLFLQPFEDLYLYGDYRDGHLAGGRIEYVRIFSLVAVFLLLIAAINFMNLSTARSGQRAREIGVRKAIGATRHSLIRQFMAESMLMACLAFVLALVLIVVLLPMFNDLTGKHIGVGDWDGRFLAAVLAITLVVGMLSGSYPALYLSSFDPLVVLRGTFKQRIGASYLRKGLVVFQFALSVMLIVGTVAVYKQMQYIRQKNLGLDRENVVLMPLEGPAKHQYEAFQQQLLNEPGIVALSSAGMSPLEMDGTTTDPVWEGKQPDDDRLFYVMETNYGFAETMKMELVAGCTFSKAFPADTANFLINEETAKVLGGGNMVGRTLDFWGRRGQVIGVLKNFHMASLYAPIEPVIFRLTPDYTNLLFVRVESGRTQEGLARLEAVYQQFNPGYPFNYRFLDQEFEEAYRSEIILGTLANIFAGLAIFISCLGLLGLVSFMTEQRTKEIGVRKVLGASVPHLVMLLTGDFTKLVLLGVVMALPVSYFAVQQWLDRFASHMALDASIFLLAGGLVLVITLLTVSRQAIKAALADPVKSLRYE